MLLSACDVNGPVRRAPFLGCCSLVPERWLVLAQWLTGPLAWTVLVLVSHGPALCCPFPQQRCPLRPALPSQRAAVRSPCCPGSTPAAGLPPLCPSNLMPDYQPIPPDQLPSCPAPAASHHLLCHPFPSSAAVPASSQRRPREAALSSLPAEAPDPRAQAACPGGSARAHGLQPGASPACCPWPWPVLASGHPPCCPGPQQALPAAPTGTSGWLHSGLSSVAASRDLSPGPWSDVPAPRLPLGLDAALSADHLVWHELSSLASPPQLLCAPGATLGSSSARTRCCRLGGLIRGFSPQPGGGRSGRMRLGLCVAPGQTVSKAGGVGSGVRAGPRGYASLEEVPGAEAVGPGQGTAPQR